MPSIVAGIEMGGTGCKVAISDENGQYDDRYTCQIVTTDPENTLRQIYEWLEQKRSERPFVAIGIACFGPVDLDKTSKTYGYITTTPKPGWQYANVVGAFKGFNIPIAFETDVNAPAMTEAALLGDSSAAYITIGTGVGVGLVLETRPVHGLMHPEGAHIKCERLPGDDYPGNCPYHGACIEGMSCAKAVADRLGILPSLLSSIPDDNPVWNVQAYYIAQLCASVIYLTSVKRIIIGGGLTKRNGLFEHIRKHVLQILNNYLNLPTILEHIDDYIVPSKLGDLIGIQSAFDIAQGAIEKQ
jgi:fructokinase